MNHIFWDNIALRSDSRRFQRVRILTPVHHTDDIYPSLEMYQGDQKNIRFKYRCHGNSYTYDKQERQVELEWISPEGRSTKSFVKIVVGGHPKWTFRTAKGWLPPNEVPQTHVNGDTFYSAEVVTENLQRDSRVDLKVYEWAGNTVPI